MIRLKRFNGSEFMLNPELIETVEAHPDTTITLATGSQFVVANSIDEVVEKILQYRRNLDAAAAPQIREMLNSYEKK